MSFFIMFGHIYISLWFALKMLHKWCSHHCMYIMWNETNEKISGLKKKGCNIFLNILPFFFWLKNILIYIFWYFDWVLCITSLLYNISHDIDPLMPLQACFKRHGYLLFQKKKTPLNFLNLYICEIIF